MSRLIVQAASQYQGKDRETFIRYVQQEPMAAAQLRAPLYEDKVVDFLFARAAINDRKATRAELEADLESEEGHVHGPGCGHDHAHEAKPKAKKGAAKPKPKAAAKAEDKLVADQPAKGPVEKASAKPKPSKPLKDAPAGKAPAAKVQAKAAAKPKAKKAPAKKAWRRLIGCEDRASPRPATRFRPFHYPADDPGRRSQPGRSVRLTCTGCAALPDGLLISGRSS